MKKILMSVVALSIVVLTTLAPQQSHARTNAAEVILDIAIIGLAVVEIDQAFRCGSGEYRYCDYYDHDRCQYQRVDRTEVINQCNEYRRYGPYDCVTTRSSSTIYIKSCNGFDRNYGHR